MINELIESNFYTHLFISGGGPQTMPEIFRLTMLEIIYA